MGVEIREATRADRAAVGEVLGAAFQVEPVYQWLFPDPAVRRRRLGLLLRALVDHMHEGMGVVQVAVDGDAIVGVAVWDAPGAVEPGRRRMLRALGEFEVGGVKTLIPLHQAIMRHPEFAVGGTLREFVEGGGFARAQAEQGPGPESSEPGPVASPQRATTRGPMSNRIVPMQTPSRTVNSSTTPEPASMLRHAS